MSCGEVMSASFLRIQKCGYTGFFFWITLAASGHMVSCPDEDAVTFRGFPRFPLTCPSVKATIQHQPDRAREIHEGGRMKRAGYTLVELLVVIAIIGILASFVLGAVSIARARARTASCASNLKEIATALDMYQDTHRGIYPLASGQHDWGDNPKGWMEQLYPYAKDKAVYKCPSYPEKRVDYGYFLSTRAAYVHANNNQASTFRELIRYPSAFVIAGDNNFNFPEPDCDKDDYTQNCLGWVADATHWKPQHGGLNVTFQDTHVKLFKKYEDRKITFRYKEYSDW
jgi:prepilin-type N-terminal cleavage/methylation domain-containing protein